VARGHAFPDHAWAQSRHAVPVALNKHMDPACDHFARPTPPRAPHPAPSVRGDHRTRGEDI
jgi:hypothetical protein